jgi:hypothetical protein
MKRFLNTTFAISIAMAATISCFVTGCKEDRGIDINRIGEKPQPVSNVKVTPVSGGAVIKYDLPNSNDLRYIKASYKLDNGIERETKASIYQNEILVDGFGQAGTYDIILTAVAVGEVSSDPVTIKADVLTPPYKLVLEKLGEGNNIEATFGGINLRYFNEQKADIIIRVIRKDADGKWVRVGEEYTNFEKDVIRIRGLQAGPADFGVYIEDRWDHFSDTLIVNLSPLEEVEITSGNWKALELGNDAQTRGGQWGIDKIWDGNVGSGNLTKLSPLPVGFVTIDLGRPVRLSRLVRWTNSGSNAGAYGRAHIYDFAVYGSNNPDQSGNWNSWTLIERFQSVRPTGLGFGTSASSAERDWLKSNGETHEFSDPTASEKYRYLRLRVYATWDGSYVGDAEIYLYELKLYGQL